MSLLKRFVYKNDDNKELHKIMRKNIMYAITFENKI